MKSKVFCANISFVLACLCSQNVLAAYPSSNVTVDFNETYNVSGTQSWKPSPDDNIFTVDGKKFILLDKDEDGNYFVLAEEHYGTYPFQTGITNKLELQEAVSENGSVSFFDKGADLTDTDSWRFNPQKETNIAYWLNNEFVRSGNTKQYILPEKIYSHIIEKEWQTEGFKAFRGWTAHDYYDSPLGVSNALDFADAYAGEPYSFNAKISLLSYTEYMQYKDKIGVTFNNSGGWSGMMLRTCDAMVTGAVSGNVRSISMTRSPLLVRTKSLDKNDNGNLVIAYADAISSDNYYIRPCFWLSKDFFKEVPCELEWNPEGDISIGSIPLEEIKKYTYNELKVIYSDGQLESLGYEIPKRDWLNYPEHSSKVTDLNAGENNSTGIDAYYKSPGDNLFYVEDKSFILLDKDCYGNYFVMANDEYGQRAFTSFSSSDQKKWREEDWSFDPDNENSIAYWLNHEFLTGGNKFKNEDKVWKLPQVIQENLIEYEWEIEPHYPINGWKVASYASDEVKAEIEAWRNIQIQNAQKRIVKCKLALMSYTEYNQYKNKIGLEKLAGGYAGFTLRTPRAQANAADDGNSWSVLVGPLQIANNTSLNKLASSTAGASNDIYYVRPVFWLSKDFFSENALDISKMGAAVRLEISDSFDYYDLKDIYSDEQMRMLCVNPEREKTSAIPEADNVIIEGIAAVGNEIFGSYRYISNDNSEAAAERASEYKWYISDSRDEIGIVCSGEKSYIPSSRDEGKYLSFSVTPENAFGTEGSKEYISRPVLVLPEQSVSVKSVLFTNENDDIIENLNGIKSLNAEISLNAKKECKIYLLVYEMDGRLIGAASKDVGLGDNLIKMALGDIEPGGGAYARVMIFEAENPAGSIYSLKF